MKLRTFKLSDAERIAELVGDKEVSRWTANIPYPYSKADAEAWIKMTEDNNDKYPFAVELNNQIVACVSFWPYGDDALEIGYWVGKEYWGKGIATEAVRMLLSSDHFSDVSKVVAKTMAENKGSQKVLLKCGFEFVETCTVLTKGKKVSGNFYTKNIK